MKDLAREHDLPTSSLYTILKQKNQLIAAFEASSSNLERQGLRESRWPRLDEALLKWFKDARTIRPPIPLADALLQGKATPAACRGFELKRLQVEPWVPQPIQIETFYQVQADLRFDSKVNIGFENIT